MSSKPKLPGAADFFAEDGDPLVVLTVAMLRLSLRDSGKRQLTPVRINGVRLRPERALMLLRSIPPQVSYSKKPNRYGVRGFAELTSYLIGVLPPEQEIVCLVVSPRAPLLGLEEVALLSDSVGKRGLADWLSLPEVWSSWGEGSEPTTASIGAMLDVTGESVRGWRNAIGERKGKPRKAGKRPTDDSGK